MMQISENIAYVLNSVGLCIDIIGAWFGTENRNRE